MSENWPPGLGWGPGAARHYECECPLTSAGRRIHHALPPNLRYCLWKHCKCQQEETFLRSGAPRAHWGRGNGPRWWRLQSHSGPRHTTASFPAAMRSVLASRKSVCEPHCSNSQKGLCEPGTVTDLRRRSHVLYADRRRCLTWLPGTWGWRLTQGKVWASGSLPSHSRGILDPRRLNLITGGKREIKLLVFCLICHCAVCPVSQPTNPRLWFNIT